MLKNTILKFLKIDGFVESLGGYIETRAELLKIEIKEEVTKSLAKLSLFFVLTLFFIISIMFISVALALWIGQAIGNIVGFVIVGGLYLVVAALLLLFKRQISQILEQKLMEIVKQKKK